MTIKLIEAELNFIEQRGLMAEEDGQPRIMGRIWGLLILLQDPVSAAQIAELLQVSRGSISTNLKLLGAMKVLKKVTRPGERETLYCIADHPYSALIENLIERADANQKMIEESLADIDNPVARQRVENLAEFYRRFGDANKALLDELK